MSALRSAARLGKWHAIPTMIHTASGPDLWGVESLASLVHGHVSTKGDFQGLERT